MTRWPTALEIHVWATPMTPVATEIATIPPTSSGEQRGVALGDRLVEHLAQQERRDHAEPGGEQDQREQPGQPGR